MSDKGREKLNELLLKLKAKEEVYKSAEEPAIAQIWLAILELLMKLDEMDRRLRAIEIKSRVQLLPTTSVIHDLKNY